ncbi:MULTISPECIES: hypothetical protein [unclassified Methylophilus]|uniref:Uncharacterized protein n=1 Tax=Methylophilus glucosoxydans TaxID=752553 RepID=A0ABW3GLR7_9PROT|nr:MULTISPECIES: hypothetical protein [unclassified Methylophilus]MBF5038522.1 hypothetical protein [Methylophilus sp. 13]MDF0378686.1 hypothetical protein [Methylophilus sp. YYY-1]
MCIAEQTLNEIVTALGDFRTVTSNPLTMLRECYPDISFLRMAERDMDEAPYCRLSDFNLYLLDTREHCVKLTRQLEHATGIVLTQRDA